MTVVPFHPKPRFPRRAVAVAVLVGLGVPMVVADRAAAAPAPVNVSPSSVVGLSIGDNGPAVKAVQQALIDAGIAVAGGADGIFGPVTAAALRAFQSERGLAVTGEVDQATAIALGLMSAPPEVKAATGLTQGVSGPEVQRVQQALIDAGIHVPGGADGIFGPATAGAVREFQAARGLPVTGVVDEATASALFGGGSSGAAPSSDSLVGLRAGMTGPAVRQLQQALLDAGLTFPGGADGIFGPATANALRKFQSERGLAVTGEVDEATAAALASPNSMPVVNPVAGGSSGASRSLVGLAPGAVGNNVRALQQALMDAGVHVPGGADGIFGPATANSLKTFQRDRGLEATGRVDEATAAALNGGGAAPPASGGSGGSGGSGSAEGFATFGERSERVRVMQQALIDAGIHVPGGADGIFGSQTAGAIMNFQRERGLPVTGAIDAATAAALGLRPSAAPAPPPTSNIRLEVFPVQGPCSFADTWHFPRGGGRLHEGVDIIAREGQYIYAATAGTITHVYHDRPGSLAGNGLRLTMPDGTYFFYAHLQGFADGIDVGTKVKAGQILGYNGVTGNAGTPHLHFEIHPGGGAAINPYPHVKAIDGCHLTNPPPQP